MMPCVRWNDLDRQGRASGWEMQVHFTHPGLSAACPAPLFQRRQLIPVEPSSINKRDHLHAPRSERSVSSSMFQVTTGRSLAVSFTYVSATKQYGRVHYQMPRSRPSSRGVPWFVGGRGAVWGASPSSWGAPG